MESKNQGNVELRLVMIGETGFGKSELGNSILLKDDAFRAGISGQSVTTECSVQKENVFGTKISIVDTPGLFDTGVPNDIVIREITRCVWMTAPGPHAILLTIRIGRLAEQVQNTIKMFQQFFGPHVTKYMIVVFTFKDQLKTRKYTKSIEEYVGEIEVPVVKDVLKECGMRYIAFNNITADEEERENQVKSLLQMIKKMVRENGGRHYTNEMLDEAEKKIKEREDQIRAEEEAKRMAEEDRIRKEYIGKIRDDMLASLKESFEALDIRMIARKEAESESWSSIIEKLVETLPTLAQAYMIMKGAPNSSTQLPLHDLFQKMPVEDFSRPPPNKKISGAEK